MHRRGSGLGLIGVLIVCAIVVYVAVRELTAVSAENVGPRGEAAVLRQLPAAEGRAPKAGSGNPAGSQDSAASAQPAEGSHRPLPDLSDMKAATDRHAEELNAQAKNAGE